MMLVRAAREAQEVFLAEAGVEEVPITRVARLPQVAQAEMELSGCGFTDERNNTKKSSRRFWTGWASSRLPAFYFFCHMD